MEASLARWLRVTRERSHSSDVHVTHQSLAFMLGVRRAGVTRAASSLQASKLIVYSRGSLTILDRRALEAAACGWHAAGRKLYASVIG